MKKIFILFAVLYSCLEVSAQMKTESISVFFKTGKYDLGKIGKHNLDSICKVFTALNITDIDIYGYTDYRGDENMNKSLSEKRVEAVIKYLVTKGINPKYIEEKKGYGKKNPKYDNKTIIGRKLNRRVEILYKYEDKSVKKEVVDSSKLIKPEPPRAKDTIIVGPKGTILFVKDCAFAPIDYKDVKWEFSEYYDAPSVQASGVRTISNEGNCLISGGMAFIKAYYQGKEIQPKCPIEIAMPTEKIDPEMQLYDADSSVPPQNTTWTLTYTPLGFDSTGRTSSRIPKKYTAAKNYYTFSTTSLGGKNCDKLKGIYRTTSLKARLRYKANYVFKIPKSAQNGIEISINDGMHNIPVQRLSSRRFYFNQRCLNVGKITATYYKDGVKMTCTRELQDLKKVKWRNMYKFKKKWFVKS